MYIKGASPNYFGKVNVMLTLGGKGGGGGGFRLVMFSDVLTKKIPTTFDINDVMGELGGGYNETS